jgi:hypothetical protein
MSRTANEVATPRYLKLDDQYFDIEWMILHLSAQQ